MKIVTVTRIRLFPFIKWHIISSFIFGLFAGLGYAISGYFWTRTNLSGYLFWYVIGIPVMYLFVGLFSGVVFISLYNVFSGSSGGYQIEVEVEERNSEKPPPPPLDFRH
jgi:hypothetical protein